MVDDGPTQWIEQLARGDQKAAQRIWERYYQQLVGLARRKLRHAARRVADEEDVVVSAFDSFCRGVADGRFPQLADHDDLWKLLMTITSRKAVAQLRRAHCKKRGAGAVRGDSVFGQGDPLDSQRPGIDQVPAVQPTPAFAAQVAECCGLLLEVLGEPSLRLIAVMKLEGFTNQQIALSLDCSLATVERKLARIRRSWSKEVDP